MSSPLVSLCIANYNGMAVIDDCLRSVRAQTGFDGGLEILVHDDASSDGSAAHLRSRHPDVRLLASPVNVGFCVANNRMAEAARGEYLLLLNNDAALLPDALATLLRTARALGRPAILSLPQYDHEGGTLLDRGCLLDPFLNPIPNLELRQEDVGMVMGACLWIPRRLWLELGGFPDWFGSIGEDLYLCCRARLAGYPVRVAGTSGYRHRVGYSFGGGRPAGRVLVTSYRRRALSERNKTFTMLLTYPTPALLLIFPLHLLLLLLEGGVLSLVRLDGRPMRQIYLACVLALWRERQRLLPLRARVQSCRRVGLRAFLAAFRPYPRKLCMLLRHGWPRLV